MKEMEGCGNCRYYLDGKCVRHKSFRCDRRGWCMHWARIVPDKPLERWRMSFRSDSGDEFYKIIYSDGTGDDIAWFRETVGEELERTRGGKWLCVCAGKEEGNHGNDVR